MVDPPLTPVPPIARCPDHAHLAEYAAGSLPPDRANPTATHLLSCHACRQAVADLQQDEELTQRLRDALGLQPEAELRRRLQSDAAADYEIFETLGSGANGVVYKARDIKLDRPVAIKCLRSAGPEDSTAAALREARNLATTSHPNIAAIYNVSELPECPFIVMEFVDGLPITEAVADRPLDQQLDAFRQTLRAVSELHRRGLIHRDLKPANVLVDRRGAVKLVDFGIARPAAVPATGSAEGTPAYLAPEQSLGRPATPMADVFSLGVILFEILTGQRPFAGHTVSEVVAAIRQADPPLPRSLRPEIPGALQAICLTALEKDPALRYPSARQFLLDLERFLEGEAVSANPTLLASVLEHGIERHITDLQRWQNDRMISTRECDYFLNRYDLLRQREEFWVLDSRRISFSQVMLHLGVWSCVVSAFLLLIFPWPLLTVARPLLPTILFLALSSAGLYLWKRRTWRVAIVLLMGASITFPIAIATTLLHFRWFSAPDPDPMLGDLMTNRQFLTAALFAFALALLLWQHTRTAAFALIWGFTAIALATAINSLAGMHHLLTGGDHHAWATVAGWYLWPGAILFALAIGLDLRWRVSACAAPLYVMSIILLLASTTLIAFQGPTLQWLGLITPDPADESRQVKYSFMINGVLFLLAGFFADRSVQSSSLRRIATLLFWLAPSHLLIPVRLLGDDWPVFSSSWTVPELLLPVAALAFVFASVPKQMKSFFFSGLFYIALSLVQITHRHFENVFAWPLSLAVTGIILALVAWRCPAVFDRQTRRSQAPLSAQPQVDIPSRDRELAPRQSKPSA